MAVCDADDSVVRSVALRSSFFGRAEHLALTRAHSAEGYASTSSSADSPSRRTPTPETRERQTVMPAVERTLTVDLGSP